MSLTRRAALLAAASLSVGLAGCVSRNLSASARLYDRAQGTYERGPRQGEADPIRVDETVVVDDSDLEYLPEKNTVRFPSLVNQSGIVASDTMPFGRWSQLQCAEAGVEAVWAVVSDRIGDDAHHIGRGATSSFPGMVVELSHDTELDEDGNVVAEPTLSFEELVGVTPESVTVSVSLDETTATHTVPVRVIKSRSGPVDLVYEDDVSVQNESHSTETGGR